MKNLQGDIVAIVGEGGNVEVRYSYDAWGNILSITDNNGKDISGKPNEIANINPLRYRGYYYDTETGLYYLKSRFYDPATGRFVNADSQLNPQDGFAGYNMYAYCGNNPVMYQDPTGHSISLLLFGLGCLVVGGILDICSGNASRRADKMMNEPSLYNVGNWLTMGTFDTVKGAVAPEEPLSLQHWSNSFSTALMILPAVGAIDDAVRNIPGIRSGGTSTPAPKSIGNPFVAGKSGIQYGVDPNTLTPQKDLTGLSPQRMVDAVRYGGDHAVIVGRTGIIQDGHHRVADAIINGRAIDIFVEPYK